MSPHVLAVAESLANIQSDGGKEMYRSAWISAQSRLCEIENRLNAITGEQCGILTTSS